ncbi:MAG: hypothetical protein H0T57_16905 [Rubrobacter sp.]|nr:hypothetical protein [Rubrobacter sp.]
MNKKFLSAAAAIAAVLAFVVFRNVSLGSQSELVKSLLTVAAIVFAILGVWVSVLDPAAVLDQKFSEPVSRKTQLAMKFAPLLRQATLLLAVTIALRFCLPLLPHPSDLVMREISRGIVGFVIAFLYLWQVGILLGTLLPIERSTNAIAVAAARRRSRRDEGRREDESEAKIRASRTLE